jgi:endonuclease/exonuclease/phosphatase family metal-dependent hydrolase
MLRPGEQRGLLQTVLDVHGRELVFMSTHIDYRPDDAERWSNVEEIEAVVRQYPGMPIILCGDFNDTPDSRVHQKLAQALDDVWLVSGSGQGFTVPAGAPRRRIDYLWVSKAGLLSPIQAWIVCSEASDHVPVVAQFQLESTCFRQ